MTFRVCCREIINLNFVPSTHKKTRPTINQSFQLRSEQRCSLTQWQRPEQKSGPAGQREGFSAPTPDTTWIRFWAAIQQHKSPGLNYITGHIVASSVETMDPINSTNRVCMCVCVHALNSPLSVSPIKAYYLECDLSFAVLHLQICSAGKKKKSKYALGVILTSGCGQVKSKAMFSMATKPNTTRVPFQLREINILNLFSDHKSTARDMY